MQYSITHGVNTINFSLERKERKAIKISVSPDLSVKVLAPEEVSIDKIKEKVKKRTLWIKRNIEYFRKLPPKMPKREYVSGETFIYLGKQYRLKVLTGKKPSLKLKNGFLFLKTANKDNFKEKENLVLGWYRDKAHIKYLNLLDKHLGTLNKHGIDKPQLKVKLLKSRWGSCSTKTNTITLNAELIKAPSHCIDYVVMHELCHLKYATHDKRFYSFLTKVMPDWKKRKERLEKVVI